MKKVFKNMFSIEGIDGAGKSTQVTAVKELLQEMGLKVRTLKSPSNTLLGEFLRKNIAKIEPTLKHQLFLIDILESLKNISETDDEIILWDRYIDSFYISNQEMTLNEAVEFTKDLPKPVKTFFLNISIEDIFSERADSVHDHSSIEWLKLKSNRYSELVKNESDRIIVLDGRQPISEITKQIVSEIKKIIKL